MYIVEKKSKPIKSLIPSAEEVNVDEASYKSLSRTSVWSLTQPKAPTDKKTKKKLNPPSSKPKSSTYVRRSKSRKTVTATQS
ncbi:hypothetical protein Tco_1326296 [Tanacetum coccineum]